MGKHEKRRLKSKGAGLFGDIKNDIIAAMVRLPHSAE